MAKSARDVLHSFMFGNMTFEQVVAEFTAMPMTLPRHLTTKNRSWVEYCRDAEEGDETDVPTAINAAHFARALTDVQAEQLLAIYDKKVL